MTKNRSYVIKSYGYVIKRYIYIYVIRRYGYVISKYGYYEAYIWPERQINKYQETHINQCDENTNIPSWSVAQTQHA